MQCRAGERERGSKGLYLIFFVRQCLQESSPTLCLLYIRGFKAASAGLKHCAILSFCSISRLKHDNGSYLTERQPLKPQLYPIALVPFKQQMSFNRLNVCSQKSYYLWLPQSPGGVWSPRSWGTALFFFLHHEFFAADEIFFKKFNHYQSITIWAQGNPF